MRIQRRIEHNDIDAIYAFLNEDILINRYLDSYSLSHWIGQPGFILDKTDDEISGLLLNANTMPDVNWIRLFASIRYDYQDIWKKLFKTSMQEIGENKNQKTAALSFVDWYGNLLKNVGFSTSYDIVVLQTQQCKPTFSSINNRILIRPIQSSDLPEIESIDHKAFFDIWQFSKEELNKTLSLSANSSVAILNGKIVGYQMSTTSFFTAHLIRLAILPQFQNQHIGRALIADLFNKLNANGIEELTVNTQSNNFASLALYQHSGFLLTDQKYPVFILEN